MVRQRFAYMSFTVYILQSTKTKRYYTGVTSDLGKRLQRHNTGRNTSTRGRGPWKIVYQEAFETKSQALKRERQIKRYKGGKAFYNLLS
ncbi:MAG: GIY-YIG nuclease family protein [Candidatus Kerfeldbacteria bacterium]|nr:GIY-YIG nuclease family protein [Candidatus Kerfeldbacteria bacterium]